MIYYLHLADFHEGLMQLSSSVKPILNHFLSLLPLPATSDFNEVVFPVQAINWDSCGPRIPEPQRRCICRERLWPLVRYPAQGAAPEAQEILAELPRASSLVSKSSPGDGIGVGAHKVSSSSIPCVEGAEPWVVSRSLPSEDVKHQ